MKKLIMAVCVAISVAATAVFAFDDQYSDEEFEKAIVTLLEVAEYQQAQYDAELKANEEWLAKEFLRIDREYGNVVHPVNVEGRNAIIGDVKSELLRQVNEHSKSVHGKPLNDNQQRIIKGEIDELLKYVDVSSMIVVQKPGNPVSGILFDYVDNVFN